MFSFFLTLNFRDNSTVQKVKTKSDDISACQSVNYAGEYDPTQKLAIFEGQRLQVPPMIASAPDADRVLGTTNGDRYIEVDLSEQKLQAWDGGNLFLETRVSSGLPGTPTPVGEFRIWIKLRATKMEGGSGRYYYNLPNVPYVMYFGNSKVPNWRGYGLHGTYWHNDFGTPRSHGCVNLPTPIAEKLYYWASPVLPEGKNIVYSSADNLGTRIVIHD